MKIAQHTINGFYLSAIVNGDYSSLTGDEQGALNTWLALAGLSFCDAIKWENVGFSTCEVSKLKADCFKVTWRL